MLKTPFKESPLVRFKLSEAVASRPKFAGVTIGEKSFLCHLNLRGDPGDTQFLDAAKSALGFDLPLKANTGASAGKRTVCWLGPNEWLIILPEDEAASVTENLHKALAGLFFALTDVSGGQTVVVVSGDNVLDVLAKGCSLDLHAREFGIGQCAQSHLGKAPIFLHKINEAPTFELVVRRSFSDYFWLWFEAASKEYGLQVVNLTTRI